MIDADTARLWMESHFGIALDGAEAGRLARLMTETPAQRARASAGVLTDAGGDALFLTAPDAHPRLMRSAIDAAQT